MSYGAERLELTLYLHDHANGLCQGSDLHFFHHPGATTAWAYQFRAGASN